jgi:hypothetical protein
VIPEADAAFVCAMEDVLEVYARPYDPENPVVCFDESPKQLVRQTTNNKCPNLRRYFFIRQGIKTGV